MSQNSETLFKNFTAFAARFFGYVWPFWDIMHWSMVRIKADGISRIRYSVLSSQAKIGMIVENSSFSFFVITNLTKTCSKLATKTIISWVPYYFIKHVAVSR